VSDYDSVQRNAQRVGQVFDAAGLPPAETLIENDVVLSWPGLAPYVVVYDDCLEVNVYAFDGDKPLWSVNVNELVDHSDDLVPVLRAALGGVVDA
jgi:hypothetical protein